jgi:hypothetical protein
MMFPYAYVDWLLQATFWAMAPMLAIFKAWIQFKINVEKKEMRH